MSFESIIATRYLRAKRKFSLISIISAISVVGITLGVAALICVLSVFNGFNSLVKTLLVGFDPHVRVEPVGSPYLDPEPLLATIRTMPHVVAAAPFVSGRSVLLHPVLRVIQIRGMRKADVSTAIGLGEKMVGGSFQDASRTNQHPIVLGTMLSFAIGASIGDTVALLSQEGLEESLTQLGQPTVIQCVVTGVFETSNKEYDSHIAYTDLETSRQVFALPKGAMGIEIRVDELERADEVAATLRRALGPAYRVETWQDLHRDLFAVMELERWAAFIILSLIIIVAVFNVLGSLTMTVIEKQRDIGIMKTMGASDRSIMRIFMLEGAFIGVIGTIAGVIAGIILSLLQQKYGLFVKLDVSVYIISSLPVEIRPADIALVAATALVLAFGAALYPARRAARLLPADAVRWE